MNFNEAVIHDLIMLENDMVNTQKELKKLKRINVIQWIAILGLLSKMGQNNINEQKMTKTEDNAVFTKCRGIGKKWKK